MPNWLVVGAGSAGSVAAARLTEDPRNTVTLLEHGPDLRRGSVPAAIDATDFTQALEVPDRMFTDCWAHRTGQVAVPYLRGRGVGGSSTVNGMIGLRGDTAQYEAWGWHDVEAAWARMRLPEEHPSDDELGTVDRALLASTPASTTVPLTRHEGRRITVAEAYLWPAIEAGNLDVRPDTSVERVILDGVRAVGVRTVSGDEVRADRVVIAAGAVHSPLLLRRSGVEVKGLGENLLDHPSVSFVLELADPDARRDGLAAGALLQHGGTQILSLNHTGAGDNARRYGALRVALMRPHGTGGRVLQGESGPDSARLDLAPLDDPRDVALLREAVVSAQRLLGESAFLDLVTAVYIDDHGTRIEQLGDGDAIDAWLRSSTGTYLHASGTCAMGTVVDDIGRVRDHRDLYVCDASVFPRIPDVNTHLPTVMLAERLAARWVN